MKVSELKEELAKHGQSTQGLKAVLLECLKEALGKHLPVLTEADQSACTNNVEGIHSYCSVETSCSPRSCSS